MPFIKIINPTTNTLTFYSSDLHKNAIVMDDTFGLLVDVLKRHKEIAAVQTEVIGAIACLADVGE